MKRLLMFAAITLLAGGLSAQAGMGEDPAAPKEEPKKEEPKKDEPKKDDAGKEKPKKDDARRPGRDRRPNREAPKVDRAVLEEEFNALDKDSDKKLTKEELGKDREPMLEKHDADKNGTIELEEWIKARSEAPARRPGGDARGDAFKNMDKDNDGKISKEEAGPRVKDNFDKWDADKDGFLTKEEFDNGIKAMGGDRPARRPEGERKPDGEKKPEGDKKPEGEKPAEPPKEMPEGGK